MERKIKKIRRNISSNTWRWKENELIKKKAGTREKEVRTSYKKLTLSIMEEKEGLETRRLKKGD